MEEVKTAKDLLTQGSNRICSFCMKTQREVKRLIESETTGAHICDECVGVCWLILARSS